MTVEGVELNDVEFARRKNIFYRSIQRLKRKKRPVAEQSPPPTPRTSTPARSRAGTGSVSESGISHSPSLSKLKLAGMEPCLTTSNGVVYRQRSGSGRKSSAPGDLAASKGRTDVPKKDDEKRPFSLFNFSGKEKEPDKPPPSPKPDYFTDVKLKKIVTEQKVVPKTTERYKLFESVYQVSLTAEMDEKTKKLRLKPVVTWSHPPLGTTKCIHLAATEKMIPDFAFPDLDLLEGKNMRSIDETYAFVQTHMSAARTIGYCRRFRYKNKPTQRLRSGTDASVRDQQDKKKNKKLTRIQKRLLKLRVWCIITKLHCFDTFSMIFDEIYRTRLATCLNTDSEVFSLLKAIGENAAPLPDNSIQIQYVSKQTGDNSLGCYEVKRPGPEDRITLLKNADLLNRLSKNMLIIIMVALFTESKVLFLDKSLSSLTSTLHALTSLLHPLEWELIYIPMLSVNIRPLIRDLVQSPSPYIIGMLKDDYSQVREHELKDTEVLVVDLTKRELHDLRKDDATTLPICEATRKSLKSQLRQVKQNKDQTMQCEVWISFLRPFLNQIDECCFGAKTKDGFRRLELSDYLAQIRKSEKIAADCKFAELLISTQMSQMWLQKQRLAISR